MFSTDKVIQHILSGAQMKAWPSGGGGVDGVRVTDLTIKEGLCFVLCLTTIYILVIMLSLSMQSNVK